ncbi:hypothetical protein V7S43_017309 [Phytophthora oleae]|uniref:ABC-2 type transporter domain-containing protein n=1 Tax=Phytophthora oleae TaxID=2107226 RepID=A0ABD3ETC6_9STRA
MLILFAFEQSAFYTLQFACILLTFPAEVYGSVQAFLTTCSFLLGLLNYAFTPWVQNGLDGDYLVVLLIMAAPVLLMYFFMGFIRTRSYRRTLNRALRWTKSSNLANPPSTKT